MGKTFSLSFSLLLLHTLFHFTSLWLARCVSHAHWSFLFPSFSPLHQSVSLFKTFPHLLLLLLFLFHIPLTGNTHTNWCRPPGQGLGPYHKASDILLSSPLKVEFYLLLLLLLLLFLSYVVYRCECVCVCILARLVKTTYAESSKLPFPTWLVLCSILSISIFYSIFSLPPPFFAALPTSALLRIGNFFFFSLLFVFCYIIHIFRI